MSANDPKPKSFTIPHEIKIFGGIVLFAVIVGITIIFEHIFFEDLKKNIESSSGRTAYIISAFIGSILGSIIWFGVFIAYLWFSKRSRFSDFILKKWFDPKTVDSPLKPFIDKLSDPSKRDSLFYPVLNESDGYLPLTISQIQQHVKSANTLLQSITEHVTDNKEISHKISTYNNDFQSWGDSWRVSAKRALELLEREAIKSQILTFDPEDYPVLLINEGLFDGQQLSTKPVTEISLVGSMVGFYVLLPNAIRNYICFLGKKFTALNIVATRSKYSSTEPHKLAYFALAFIGRTIESIINGRCKKCFQTEEKLNFNINLFITPFDFMNAAILMHDKSISILQALDPKSVLSIIEDGIQIGLKVRKKDSAFPIGESYFERYNEVIKEYKDQIDENDIEFWHISGNKEEIIIEINNRHWDDYYNFQIKPQGNKSFTKNVTKDEITQFLRTFLQNVRQKAGTSNIDGNNQLKERFDTPCNCEKLK